MKIPDNKNTILIGAVVTLLFLALTFVVPIADWLKNFGNMFAAIVLAFITILYVIINQRQADINQQLVENSKEQLKYQFGGRPLIQILRTTEEELKSVNIDIHVIESIKRKLRQLFQNRFTSLEAEQLIQSERDILHIENEGNGTIIELKVIISIHINSNNILNGEYIIENIKPHEKKAIIYADSKIMESYRIEVSYSYSDFVGVSSYHLVQRSFK